jgi:twinkle protein
MAFVKTHLPCTACESSDGLSLNEDGSTKCFACDAYTPPVSTHMATTPSPTKKETPVEAINALAAAYLALPTPSIGSRRITMSTCDHFGVVADGTKAVWFPYHNQQGKIVAVKKRMVAEKKFFIEGDWKETGLFGQNKFTKGGKYVTIVEGEYDALAVFQMLGSKWPVVSIKSGAAGAVKDCKAAYEWLNSFENIVVCFDSDEPGQQASSQVAALFGSKAKVFKPTEGFKDGCDWLLAGKEKEFIDRWWAAERYMPDGIVAGSSLWEDVSRPLDKAEVAYPFMGLNKLTYGIRKGELVTVTAGSGLGKSQFLREIIWNILCKTEENIGLMFLEESVRKTGLSLMSLAANKPLHLPDVEATEQEKRDAFDATLGTDRVYMFDHFGSTNIENIVSRTEEFARAFGCGYVFLDHVSIVVSAQSNGDERKALDSVMTSLRTLVQNTGISLIIVSHLKRPESKGHEEGAVTSLAQLRGSGAIAQLSDMVIGLERNGQAEDETERNTTKVRVLKNRFSGLTGPACSLLYSRETGRMSELEEEKL